MTFFESVVSGARGMRFKEEPITEPAETEVRRNDKPCTHRDVAGDSAWEDFGGVFFCGICGERGK